MRAIVDHQRLESGERAADAGDGAGGRGGSQFERVGTGAALHDGGGDGVGKILEEVAVGVIEMHGAVAAGNGALIGHRVGHAAIGVNAPSPAGEQRRRASVANSTAGAEIDGAVIAENAALIEDGDGDPAGTNAIQGAGDARGGAAVRDRTAGFEEYAVGGAADDAALVGDRGRSAAGIDAVLSTIDL